MTIKQFKSKFNKVVDSIEKDVDKLKALSEEVDDEELGNLVSEFADNISMLAVEATLENVVSDVNLNSILEYIEDVENESDEYMDSYDEEKDEE